MQNYTKFQKFISFLLIFSILFSFTINISFFSFVGNIFASDWKRYNVVSIFVEEEIYSSIKSEVTRYAEDIQWVLENTKTIIIPTSKDEHPFNIASLNEKLYFEWYKWLSWLSWDSQLVWSVFIWDLSLPVVENNWSYEKTIFPYVDFQDKLYVYDNWEKRYTLNNNFKWDPKAEIWHWFISPNTWNESEDIQSIKDYFNKNHDYYTWEWKFQTASWITNWKQDEDVISDYEPYVFYYDQIRESKAVKYVNYKAYEQFLDNIEDLNYNRYSKDLVEKLSKTQTDNQTDINWDVETVFWTGFDIWQFSSWSSLTSTTWVPDIQTRYIVNNSIKRLVEIFNSSAIWEMRKNVYNAWRYNVTWNDVSADLVPYLASNIDILSEAVIRNVNNDLENKIDSIVKTWLSRKIAIPTEFSLWNTTYTNFLYWMQASKITSAESCSIYRWSTYNSWTLVEANRWYNVGNVSKDISLCNNWDTMWYWWGYSPVNIDRNTFEDLRKKAQEAENLSYSETTSYISDMANISTKIWKLNYKAPNNAIVPILDVKWSLKETDETKNPKPQYCFNNNLILTQSKDTEWQVTFSVPINWASAVWFSCSTSFQSLSYSANFSDTYKNFPTLPVWSCETHTLNLDWSSLKTISNNDCETSWSSSSESSSSETTTTIKKSPVIKTYNFKKIDSSVTHKSPTSPELSAQVQYMASPNLPIDKDRYIDFISADDTYWKINYPYLFRIWWWAKSLDNAREIVKKYLDDKSKEINDLIKSKDPSKLSWTDSLIYNLLKSWTYPDANVDLYKYLSEKPTKELNVLWDTKEINYLETLVFAVYWNSLNSVSAKYKFVFENYLSDQFWTSNGYFLPKNKKQYEMSYVWAPWDVQNMYIKLDPEEKWENPYASIMAQNQNLLNSLLFSNVWWTDKSLFKCAPPEWVPIWKWVPAVMCRLKEILPPTISINEWNCWYSMLTDWDEWSFWNLSQEDLNKNWIVDVIENAVRDWSVELKTDSDKYYYNKSWTLTANVLDESWNKVSYDSVSLIRFELVRVDVPTDSYFDRKTVFDKYWESWTVLNSAADITEAKKYINFTDFTIRAKNWTSTFVFSTKWKDAYVTFRANLMLKDSKWNIVIQKEDFKEISIRWDLFHMTSYKLSPYAWSLILDTWTSNVSTSWIDNIYLVWEKAFKDLKSNLNTLNSYSSSKEKLFLSLSNKDKNWNELNLSFPIKVNIYDSKSVLLDTKTFLTLDQVSSLWFFKKTWTYKFEIIDRQNTKITKEIEILPWEPKEFIVNLWTNLIETWWVITTNVFNINDEFWNPTAGQSYKVEASISWWWVTFDDWTTTKTFTTFEGFSLFKLKSTNNTWTSSINFKVYVNWTPTLMTSKTIKTVDKIDFEVNWLPNEIKVWENKYNFEIVLKNTDSSINFSSKAYLVSNPIYITSNDDFIQIQNNKWVWSFLTTKKAWEAVNLEFQIEWVKNNFSKQIDILPDVPLRLDLSLSKSKLEASEKSTTQLYAELKDRYDNVVWNDNKTKLTLEIHQKYTHVVTSTDKDKVSSKWKATFTLNATDTPWVAFFKVSTDPSLSLNKVEISWQSPFSKNLLTTTWMKNSDGTLTTLWKTFFTEYDTLNYRFKFNTVESLQENTEFKTLTTSQKASLISLFNSNNKLTLNWVWENAWRIDTYYFWNKEKINWNSYNSIYTTLLWSSYWDITVKDNLANSIIFDKNNRWLAVTSLLNNIVKKQNVLNINPNWNIKLNSNSSDLSSDISTYFNLSSLWDLELSFFNNTYSKLVSKIFFNIKSDDLSVKDCTTTDLTKCFTETTKNEIWLKSQSSIYTVYQDSNWVSLLNTSWDKVLSITNNWKIQKLSYINFELNKTYSDFFAVNIKVDSSIIWVLAIKFNNSQLNVIRDLSLLDNVKTSTIRSSMILYLEWRDYFYETDYLWTSTKDNIWYKVYYNDPFWTDTKETNSFWDYFDFWYENFEDEGWIWWSWLNKSLLSFAAWKSVWDATKDYMTFSLINIWDPVVSLKSIKKKLPWTPLDRKFDSTIWKLISKDANNLSYSVLDYNNDDIKDVVILKRDWYIELLEWTTDLDNFINKWNIAYIPDHSDKWIIQTGDFTWDSYDDIFVVNEDSKPVLLNNVLKNFSRVDLENKFNLTWRIMQAFSYDMDKDGVDDVVTYDDSWTITIFYWFKWTSENPRFTKKIIETWLWLTLNSSTRNDNSLVYFDSLYQLQDDDDYYSYMESNEAFQSVLKQNISKLQAQTTSEDSVNEELIDNLIFSKLNYTPFSFKNTDTIKQMLANMPQQMVSNNSDISDINSSYADAMNSVSEMVSTWWFLDTYNTWNNSYIAQSNDNNITTFIKWEYSDLEWLKLEKKYTDINWWSLVWWDKILLEVNLENTSNTTLRDIALVEAIPEAFSLEDNGSLNLSLPGENISSTWIIMKNAPDSWYSFLLDSYINSIWETRNIILRAWEKLKLSLVLKTLPFDYWNIEVWLFEWWEEWDDDFWDIIFKVNKKSCEDPYSIYRSTSDREYEKWSRTPTCELWTLNDLDKNQIDEDENWIPDYLDEIIKSWTTNGEAFQNFSQDAINDLLKDSDSDWIPDRDDITPYYSSDEDFMWSLWSVDSFVEQMSDWIDHIMAWMSCWFGWGSCIWSPLNWAPLAPWSDPTLFWFPIWDWLKVWEWLPVFAYPTIPSSPLLAPMWPPSPLWAWGRLDWTPTWLWISQFRLFITPTITWAIWTAICFGPNVWWWLPPPWLHPLVIWWNCIVAAVPLLWCSNDWSDWEIYNVTNSTSWNIYNWNCSNSTTKKSSSNSAYLSQESVKDYLYYKRTWTKSWTYNTSIKDSLSRIAKWNTWWWLSLNRPLINAFEWAEWTEVSIDIDGQAFKDWNFEDVVKLRMDRISPFPDFLMDWVTRQIEEIVTKLTDFPTLYIILPDFSGIFDGFDNFIPNLKWAYSSWEEKWKEKEQDVQNQINDLQSEKASLNCDDNPIKCNALDFEVWRLELERDSQINQVWSWIKAVYEFLSNLPMIAISPEKVYVNVPWVDINTVNKTLSDFQITKQQWTEELKRAKEAWSFWEACSGTPEEIKECEAQNEAASKVIVDAESLINSIDQNIETLQDYKNFPEKLHKLIKYKEIRLEQILCNIETISYILWWRIWDNWKRFKAWVELYVLIKAILKSWQLLIDIFLDYDAECIECKNERYDLRHFIWKLISMVIPKIPVIQFPKWPDIYIDLHNIRVWILVGIPEFEFNLRPILLPTLPNLYLPEVPTLNIKLPSLPILPTIEIPDLPLLPSLPEVKLPDLPPPPTLPRMIWALQAMLSILKLVTKIMCFLRSTVLVPEWKAWDAIAFITERPWYLPIDFIDISLPQFSLPFVDAIKVTTWVNLEFEAEFLVEAARQSMMPINVFTNDIVNIFDISFMDLDFRGILPTEVNVWVDPLDSDQDNTNIEVDDYSIKIDKNKKISLFDFSMVLAANIWKLHNYIAKNSNDQVSTDEFKKIMANELSKDYLYKEAWTSKIAWVWQDALKYSFTKEDKFIQDLVKNNEDKFNALKDILNEEKAKNRELQKNIEQVLKDKDKNIIKVSSTNEEKVSDYNSRLLDYNLKTVKSALNLYKKDSEVAEIKSMWKDLNDRVSSWLSSFSANVQKAWEKMENDFNKAKTLALNTDSTSSAWTSKIWPLALSTTTSENVTSSSTTTSTTWQSCKIGWENWYIYKWLYYVEEFLKRKISYRLFDYLDEVDWNEVYYERDFDNDKDDDVIYMVWTEIFVKENLQNKKETSHYTWSPTVLSKSDNDFYNSSNKFYESVNNFKESVSDNNYINLSFLQPTNDDLANFRVEFFQIIDKFSNIWVTDYIPEWIKKYVIDAFRDIDDITVKTTTSDYTIRNNLAYIRNIWNLTDVRLYTKELKDIEEDLSSNNEVIINSWKKLYTSWNATKLVYYNYSDKNNDLKYKDITIPAYSSVDFNTDIVVASLNNPLFVEWEKYVTLTWNDIVKYLKKPLIPWAEISFLWDNTYNNSSYLWIEYYDWTTLDLDFSESNYYKLYDLWNKSESYLIRTEIENDNYYAKVRTFSKWVFWTYSNQVLLSPQIYSDTKAPQISSLDNLKVPVYQKKQIDLSDYIFEDSWFKNIKDISIDFDLSKDTSWDWNTLNDKDYYIWKTNSNINIKLENNKVLFDVWPFNELINKRVRIYVTDTNDNTWYRDVNFLVYAPTPKIESIENKTLISWKLDEAIKDEPINFYRYRWWSLTRLKDANNQNTALSTSTWSFSFKTWENKEWLNIYDNTSSWKILATIDEKTWKINTWINSNLSILVYPSDNSSNDVVYPKIILSNWNENIYYQYLRTPNVWEVKEVNDFAWNTAVWVYFRKTSNDFESYKMPIWINNNAWDLFIYDKNDTIKTSKAVIFKDARVNTFGNFSLEYTTFWNYVVYKIMNSSVEVWRIMIIPEENYVMK